jgi:uncharacterized protein
MEGEFCMFRDMRRKDKEISTDEVEAILRTGTYGILGSIGQNGYPYTLPMSYAYKEGVIYMHGALEGQKLDNIRFSDKVSFCVVGEVNTLPEKFSTNYESVIAFGKASIISGAEKNDALVYLIEKYSNDFKKEGLEYISKALDMVNVIKIEIERVTGKAGK